MSPPISPAVIWVRTPTALAAAALALAACTQNDRVAPPPSGSPSPDPSSEHCGADRLEEYVGMVSTRDIITRIRDAVGHDRVRIIGPNDAVTMDYRPDRLNVEIGEKGRIQRIRCG